MKKIIFTKDFVEGNADPKIIRKAKRATPKKAPITENNKKVSG